MPLLLSPPVAAPHFVADQPVGEPRGYAEAVEGDWGCLAEWRGLAEMPDLCKEVVLFGRGLPA